MIAWVRGRGMDEKADGSGVGGKRVVEEETRRAAGLKSPRVTTPIP